MNLPIYNSTNPRDVNHALLLGAGWRPTKWHDDKNNQKEIPLLSSDLFQALRQYEELFRSGFSAIRWEHPRHGVTDFVDGRWINDAPDFLKSLSQSPAVPKEIQNVIDLFLKEKTPSAEPLTRSVFRDWTIPFSMETEYNRKVDGFIVATATICVGSIQPQKFVWGVFQTSKEKPRARGENITAKPQISGLRLVLGKYRLALPIDGDVTTLSSGGDRRIFQFDDEMLKRIPSFSGYDSIRVEVQTERTDLFFEGVLFARVEM